MPHCVEVVARALQWSSDAPKTGRNRDLAHDGRQALDGTEVAMHLPSNGLEGDAMSICGVITTKDVLRHSGTIVREFGTVAYIRCCMAILMRRRTTFLNCVCELRQ